MAAPGPPVRRERHDEGVLPDARKGVEMDSNGSWRVHALGGVFAMALAATAVAAPPDASVRQAQYAPAQPSGQAPAPPAPSGPPVMPANPVYNTPAAPPVYAALPQSAPVVLQPQAATVIVGPTPPPNIVIASAPATAPTVTYATVAPPPASTPNLFLAPSPTAAPQSAAAAPATQALYLSAPVPAAAAPTALVLMAPNLLDRALGTLGEHLARRKNPRVQLATTPAVAAAPTYAAPLAASPSLWSKCRIGNLFHRDPAPAPGPPGAAPQPPPFGPSEQTK